MNLGIGYESSDEEETTLVGIPDKTSSVEKPPEPASAIATQKIVTTSLETKSPVPSPVAKPLEPQSESKPPPKSPPRPVVEAEGIPEGPISGPALGPTASPPPATSNSGEDTAPGSPYTTSRAIIRNLTLPTIPNFNIPDSPPGSPPAKSTKKFAQFLDLKKKGQHFNRRLEGSSVLRDPGHLQRLMNFAGIREEDQYESTLPVDIAVPTAFPRWAYAEELRESQKKILKAREETNARNPRDSIVFVPAAKLASGTSSRSATPSGKDGGRESGAERIMAGLASQGQKRKELERRGGREESLSSQGNRSRSPKRRREGYGR